VNFDALLGLSYLLSDDELDARLSFINDEPSCDGPSCTESLRAHALISSKFSYLRACTSWRRYSSKSWKTMAEGVEYLLKRVAKS
jgi:hypothetical protein